VHKYVKAKAESIKESEMHKQNKIKRPDNENCYSEEDYDFMRLFPDTHDPKYMEPFIKLVYESYRKNPA
jgi:hypothetical protein